MGLREDLARIAPDDTVTVRLTSGNTLRGKVREAYGSLWVEPIMLRYESGRPGGQVVAVLSHEPAPKPRVTVEELDALPACALVDDGDGSLWPKREDGMWGIGSSLSSAELLAIYPDITIVSYGPLPKP